MTFGFHRMVNGQIINERWGKRHSSSVLDSLRLLDFPWFADSESVWSISCTLTVIQSTTCFSMLDKASRTASLRRESIW